METSELRGRLAALEQQQQTILLTLSQLIQALTIPEEAQTHEKGIKKKGLPEE